MSQCLHNRIAFVTEDGMLEYATCLDCEHMWDVVEITKMISMFADTYERLFSHDAAVAEPFSDAFGDVQLSFFAANANDETL